MPYLIKEIFHSLQGEGYHSGRSAVFCRFEGCNLKCHFCDTDYAGIDGANGGVYECEGLASKVAEVWANATADVARKFVVITGGEPLLQVDEQLLAALHKLGFEIAVETNGTLAAPRGVDWICVSPKANAALSIRSGDELKLVFPQDNLPPSQFENLAFSHFYLQPMAGEHSQENTRLAVDYCLRHLRWRLSLQLHKIVGIE